MRNYKDKKDPTRLRRGLKKVNIGGADSFLTVMSEGNDEVRLILSDEKIEGADFLILKGMRLFE